MSATPNDVLAFFNSAAIIAAEPNTGRGSWRPPESDYDVIVEDLIFSTEKFRYKIEKLGPDGKPRPEQRESPAGGLTFKYRLLEDPESPTGTPRTFLGKTFQIPPDAVRSDPNLPTGQKDRIRFEDERLMGHVQTLTGQVPTSPGALPALLNQIKASIAQHTTAKTALVVRCSVRYGEGKTKSGKSYQRFESEFLTEMISR